MIAFSLVVVILSSLMPASVGASATSPGSSEETQLSSRESQADFDLIHKACSEAAQLRNVSRLTCFSSSRPKGTESEVLVEWIWCT